MRILLASSEVYPYSKTGGLADSVGALGKALTKAGNQVGIVTPLHRGIREQFPQIKRVDWRFDLSMGAKRTGAELWAFEPSERLTVYFIHKPEYFDRAGIYNENGADYGDNAERFIFFSKCVTHLARYLPWRPEVVHVNDWHTGLVPLMVLHQSRAEGWGNPPKVCLTIHNLAYQGIFPKSAYALVNLPPNYFGPEGVEFYGQMNFLKAGIIFANVITTVSPRYSREITTQEFGVGLDGLLRKRQNHLLGILNGVDYEEWNTEYNPCLASAYSIKNLSGKATCKSALQRELSLTINNSSPVFGTVSRLTEQKGMDILLPALEETLATVDLQYILLGSGAAGFERRFLEFAKRFPGKVAVRLGYDQAMAHQIEAGCDFYIMPSRFEPCGLNQLYSLRYGTIPIVRRTGGLDDTVIDATDDESKADGIKFNNYSVESLVRALRKALVVFGDESLLKFYQANGMKADFSWDRIVKDYLNAYNLKQIS